MWCCLKVASVKTTFGMNRRLVECVYFNSWRYRDFCFCQRSLILPFISAGLMDSALVVWFLYAWQITQPGIGGGIAIVISRMAHNLILIRWSQVSRCILTHVHLFYKGFCEWTTSDIKCNEAPCAWHIEVQAIYTYDGVRLLARYFKCFTCRMRSIRQTRNMIRQRELYFYNLFCLFKNHLSWCKR